MSRLGGTLFIRNGIQFDYCFVEAINCLKAFCDEVIVLDAGSDDGTEKIVAGMADSKTKVILLDKDEWEQQRGREKLAYFTNRAIEHLTTEWNFNLQADEIVHEKSYDTIHKAINSGLAEAYMCSRINLWHSPYLQLNVEHARMPCSKEIIRLTKSCYRSWGDGESIDAQCIYDFVQNIRIYHLGFVRSKKVMVKKIINMQRDVFEIETDKKLDGMEVFDPTAWFDPKKDLRPIDEPLPAIIQQWAKERIY
jgi:glycosyltransferase involved in cell wall biosynthesis